jgi:SNF2 family DNA or RNA helicase
MRFRSDLHDYQRRAVDFIIDKKRCALWLEMGLGKTVSTLTAISDLLDSFAINRVLVIAPLRVANSVWGQEAAAWKHLMHLRMSICTGSERERLLALRNAADLFVINRENVPWLVKQYGKSWPFDCVVVDESSSFKNASTRRFRALRKTLPETTHMILLSGTPSPNGLLDLWSQTYLVDNGASLGKTISAYKSRFFQSDYMGYKLTPRKGAFSEIHKLISPCVLSMRASDYMQLPDRIDLVEKVKLPAGVMQNYLNFEKDLFLQLSDGEEVEAVSAAVLANKLLQYSNGAMYTDKLGNWSQVHADKMEALVDLLEQNAGENVLLAYSFKSDLERILKRFPHARVLDKNPETIREWNSGKIPLLLAHPASGGHGLNLQNGGSLVIWFGLNWSLELYQQLNARLHRQGQEKPVRILHLITADTIEERVFDVIRSKDIQQSKLLNALRPH